MTALSKYNDITPHPPAYGYGFNLYVLRAARLGVYAGIDPQQIADDIRRHVPPGSRPTLSREITRALNKVTNDSSSNGTVVHYDFKKKKQKPAFDGPKARNKIIDLGAGIEEADIWDVSPVKINWPHEEDPQHLFTYLYHPDNFLFLGDRYTPGIHGKTIRSASEWQQYFADGGQTYPHIIPNPLSGKPGLTQDGKPTLRGDECVKSFRLATVEFDNLSHEDQLAFWWGVNLPVVALIDSGNKSIHGWIRIDNISTAEAWTEQVEHQLFKNILVPLGVDGACKNESRLSRLPGHQRDNGRMQKLLYLAPEGRRVNG